MTEDGAGRTSSGLARTDALAAQLIARAAPLVFSVAQSPAEREAVYRLRYSIVVEKGWARPEDLPDGVERDAYDDTAVQIVAWDADELAATARLVPPVPGHPLPTEETFGLKIESRTHLMDVGRTCVAPAYRDPQHRVLAGLLGRTWIELRAGGCTEACGIVAPAVVRMCRGMGFHVVILGAPRLVWGEERSPVLIRPAESPEALTRRIGMRGSAADHGGLSGQSHIGNVVTSSASKKCLTIQK
ncbi:MAG: GNAT family N-acetyltransferase [Candidatus Methylomirabilis oxyfera]|nr:GNAT family N-acetyltransferase [Candidatus Methylomirabilis oxyfera]